MGRYTGPKTKKNRQFSFPVFGPTKAFEKRPHLPGIHGPRLRRKVSGYSLAHNAKQILRLMYGLLEKQFYATFQRAKKRRGVTGEAFLMLLETRLDNVVYLLGFAKSRRASRQLVNHGHVMVNGHKVDIASYNCKVGDVIEVRSKTSSKQLATRSLDENQYRVPPAWVVLDAAALKGTVLRMPTRDEMEPGVNEQLIVEFYSR